MTHDDAVKLAKVIETVDGGCTTCIADACWELNRAFPEWVWSLEDEYTSDRYVSVSAPKVEP